MNHLQGMRLLPVRLQHGMGKGRLKAAARGTMQEINEEVKGRWVSSTKSEITRSSFHMQTAISRMTHDLGAWSWAEPKETPRVRPVGLETVREKPEVGEK